MGHDFDDYVRARTRALVKLAYVLTGDSHLAEDVVQEVLARANRRWHHISKADSPQAYVRRMIVNEVRSRQRRRRVFLMFRPSEQIPEHPVIDAAQATSERDAAWALVSSLPPRQRAVLVLRYYEDLPDQQIAETLSISAATVRSTASRALAALRAHPDITPTFIPDEPSASAHQAAPCTQGSR